MFAGFNNFLNGPKFNLTFLALYNVHSQLAIWILKYAYGRHVVMSNLVGPTSLISGSKPHFISESH